jgi:hypothetical protein
MKSTDWPKYALMGVAFIFLVYLTLNLMPKDDATIEIVDKDGNILAHEAVAARSFEMTQAAGAANTKRVRLPDTVTQAIEQPEAANLILSLKLKNDGNVPINVTLSNAMLVGGFR